MFEISLAADVGSATTRLATRNQIESQQSRVALDPDNSCRVLAIGNESRKLLNASPAYPVRNGAIANTQLASILLRRLALNMLKRKTLYGVVLRMAVPNVVSDMQKAAAAEMAREAGFKSVRLVDALLMGAIGAGVDVDSHTANMVVDIGHDRLNTMMCANGGIVAESVSGMGSRIFDRTLQSYFAGEHRMLIGATAAEKIKREMDRPLLLVNGRCADTGLPKKIEVHSVAVRDALKSPAAVLAREIEAAINKTPPESASDVYDNGLWLIGGGAMQYGLAMQLSNYLGLEVHVAANAEQATIFGMQSVIWKARSFVGEAAYQSSIV